MIQRAVGPCRRLQSGHEAASSAPQDPDPPLDLFKDGIIPQNGKRQSEEKQDHADLTEREIADRRTKDILCR